MNNSIKYIKQDSIDKIKWDQLVESTRNSLIFNYSWYLDKMCTWDAIILEDYQGAIAIPFNHLCGLKKVYQPNFVQKCNWFGAKPEGNWEADVLKILKTYYKRIHFNTDFKLLSKSTYRINLILRLTEYAELHAAFSNSLKRNLRRSVKSLKINENLKPDETVRLYKLAHGKNNPQLQNIHYTRICELVNLYSSNFKCINVTCGNETVASILLACHNNRMHYILGAPSELGKKLNALSVAINYAIENNCGSNKIFDFEGSILPTVKKFYTRFSPEAEIFYESEFLPAYLKLFQWAYKRLLRS